jgi:acetyl-CoA acetyltransferase
MAKHPFHDIVLAGVHNTVQAKRLDGHTSESITLEAVRGVMDDAGITPRDIDGVSVASGGRSGLFQPSHFAYLLGLGPAWNGWTNGQGIGAVLEAASAIATGQCHTVIIGAGSAGVYTELASTAPWTRPHNEFVASWGLFTAAEFALIARRHMHMYGTTPWQLATVSATIRNNGHINPDAIYQGRGPFTPQDILDSRMVADPFHLLDCAMTSEGGCGIIVTTAERARDMKQPPIYLLGGARERNGPSYCYPPTWEQTGYVGRDAARKSFDMAGMTHEDVDDCEFYDPFSFEIIRQFEAFGFCGEGEGGDFIMNGAIELDGKYPICTDGGLMSFSHGGSAVQLLQKVIAGVKQLRGEAGNRQLSDPRVAMSTNGGAGALFTDVMLMGKEQP